MRKFMSCERCLIKVKSKFVFVKKLINFKYEHHLSFFFYCSLASQSVICQGFLLLSYRLCNSVWNDLR